jgi:hypothetical protein
VGQVTENREGIERTKDDVKRMETKVEKVERRMDDREKKMEDGLYGDEGKGSHQKECNYTWSGRTGQQMQDGQGEN